MNIVIYARYSSNTQNEQSIEGQLKTCYDFAKRNGYKIINEYIDRAISGTGADNRPSFQKMIADSAKRQFQAILVYQLDRFARNRYDSATYKARLKKNGVKVLSARENITDDASGVLMEAVLEGMAEYFSTELSQKVRRGLKLNAEKGLCTGGNTALGLKTNEEKQYVIDEEKAPIVKHIFEMYLAGSTMAKIIKYLNENQIKTSLGNPYNKNSIRKILTNKRYIGIYTFKGTEFPDMIPQIIDNNNFDEVQLLMSKNKKAPARAKAIEDNYILTTKIFCGHCKAAITGVSGTSHTGAFYQYYQCINNKRKKCKKKTVRKEYIEDLVVNETVKILTPENIDRIAHSVVDLCEKERNTDSIKRINKLIRENEAATANLVKALEAGKVVDVISAQIEKRQAEKADLEVQLAKEKIQSPVLKYNEVKFFFERFVGGDISDINYRRALVDIFVNKIYLFDDEMRIVYNAGEGHKIDVPLDELTHERGSSKGMFVPLIGLEPIQYCYRRILSPLRLPIPPQRHKTNVNIELYTINTYMSIHYVKFS